MHLKFSQDIESLLKRLAIHPLTLKEILAETSERGFCLIISLLVLPFLIPTPPGLTTIFGLGCLILSAQMAIGRRTPWLPSRIAQFRVARTLSQSLLANLGKVTGWLEKIIRPRWSTIANNPYIWQINGLCLLWLTLLLMLPIPFTNPIPTIGILLLSVATLEGDGLLMTVSYGLTLLITLFFAFMGYALWQAPQYLPSMFS